MNDDHLLAVGQYIVTDEHAACELRPENPRIFKSRADPSQLVESVLRGHAEDDKSFEPAGHERLRRDQ